tara:strand:- start:148 stop:318 length:171 start_codon:yes stop_codon:yes gene_type:complete
MWRRLPLVTELAGTFPASEFADVVILTNLLALEDVSLITEWMSSHRLLLSDSRRWA